MPKISETFSSTLEEPVHLAAFEGPLDLLLYLVRRDEIDIYDIPIAEVARQYMDVITRAQEGRLEVAGDFFVLAASLMRIKSRLLLPAQERPEVPEDEALEDPRWELAKMLLEYRRFKDAAGELSARIDAAMDLLPRRIADDAAPEPETASLEQGDRFAVWGAYNRVLRRLAERMREGRVEPERISVSDCMESIRGILRERGSFLFTDLFPAEGPVSRVLVAASFLALLELVRLGALFLRQNAAFDDIECRGAA
ncbi:MAG: segregation/condensation protein A [Opitutales bacterium]|jgi:segregation and condensation protein A